MDSGSSQFPELLKKRQKQPRLRLCADAVCNVDKDVGGHAIQLSKPYPIKGLSKTNRTLEKAEKHHSLHTCSASKSKNSKAPTAQKPKPFSEFHASKPGCNKMF